MRVFMCVYMCVRTEINMHFFLLRGSVVTVCLRGNFPGVIFLGDSFRRGIFAWNSIPEVNFVGEDNFPRTEKGMSILKLSLLKKLFFRHTAALDVN